MKRIIILFVIILISFPILAEEKLHLKIGSYENAPKIFTVENRNISGYWADITNYIAAEEGWDKEWIHGGWDQCLEYLEKLVKERTKELKKNNIELEEQTITLKLSQNSLVFLLEDMNETRSGIQDKGVERTS